MRKSRDLVWKETNVGEMYTFIGLAILHGIVRKPTIYSYHSTNQMLVTPIFGEMHVKGQICTHSQVFAFI